MKNEQFGTEMTRIACLPRIVAVLTAILMAGPLSAQETLWLQIEARRSLAEAEERARAYNARLGNVVGFRLASGWHAIALGPYSSLLAEGELARLLASREIPGDSFVADGTAYREQFWPGPGERSAAVSQPEVQTPLPTPQASDETPAQARASERALTRADREDLQRALKAAGFYASGIDGDFGPGTRRAMAAWQAAEGFEATGVMTTQQRAGLVNTYREVRASLDLRPVLDGRAGIEVTMPQAEVAFADYDAPFARYEGNQAQVLLISQTGDRDTLQSLYDVMQTLEIVPLEGPRSIRRGRFTIEGTNSRYATYVEAALTTDGIKGFALVWRPGDDVRRRLALEAMQASFSPIPGAVLPDNEGDLSGQRPDLVAGLEIRKPDLFGSGFFVDENGAVLTAVSSVEGCARITLDGASDATIQATEPDLGLALLAPGEQLAPLGIGRFRASPPRLQSEIAVAGYSYGGVLGAPTISFGTVEDIRGLNGEEPLARLALSARPGDAGGPILDSGGGVLGMLLPRAQDTDQSLPPLVRFAADAEAIAAFLGENGIALAAPTPETPLEPEDIALIGADMTVLVECWN